MSTVEKAMDRLRGGDTSATARRFAPAHSEHEAASDSERARIDIDRGALRRSGLMPPKKLEAQFRREYQRVKRAMMVALDSGGHNAPDGNRIMITSPNPGEGKTFTTFNLALSIASELDYSVLLVDGDVAHPMISRSLNLRQHPGLMDVLVDRERSPESVIVDTNRPRLAVMPAGAHSHNMVEHLSSQRMAEVMRTLSADPSRIVLVDTPPLLAAVESQAISHHVGRIVVVVAAEVTEQRALTTALSLIDVDSRDVSLVLNASRGGPGDEYSYYYRSYYYGEEGSARA